METHTQVCDNQRHGGSLCDADCEYQGSHPQVSHHVHVGNLDYGRERGKGREGEKNWVKEGEESRI